MKPLAHIPFIVLATACAPSAERIAERALREGEDPYRAMHYPVADSIYATAAFDPRAAYNLGNALYEQHLLDTAIQAYRRAIDASTDETTRSQAFYNQANGWAALAFQADSLADEREQQASGMDIQGTDLVEKVRRMVVLDSLRKEHARLESLVDSALAQGAESYKHALRRTPSDEDARHNLALVQDIIAKRVKEAADKAKKDQDKNKELSERAKQLMAQADALVEQYKFTEALKLLRDGLKSEPSLQQQQEYMQKLDVVTKAAQAT